MRFWDSSAVVPLLVEEAGTTWALRQYRSDPIVLVWWWTEVECASALARLERSGGVPSAAAAEARARLGELKAEWQGVQPIEAVRESALRMLRVHDLRAADSLQLAAALVACQHRASTLEFVCLDERLGSAARKEGFRVADAAPER